MARGADGKKITASFTPKNSFLRRKLHYTTPNGKIVKRPRYCRGAIRLRQYRRPKGSPRYWGKRASDEEPASKYRTKTMNASKRGCRASLRVPWEELTSGQRAAWRKRLREQIARLHGP
jgi:hypothetical protein